MVYKIPSNPNLFTEIKKFEEYNNIPFGMICGIVQNDMILDNETVLSRFKEMQDYANGSTIKESIYEEISKVLNYVKKFKDTEISLNDFYEFERNCRERTEAGSCTINDNLDCKMTTCPYLTENQAVKLAGDILGDIEVNIENVNFPFENVNDGKTIENIFKEEENNANIVELVEIIYKYRCLKCETVAVFNTKIEGYKCYKCSNN